MADATTVYEIHTRYVLQDQASKGVENIAQSAERASRSTSSLGSQIRGLAQMAAGGFFAAKAKDYLVGFNDEIEQARITMAGMMQLNVGGAFAENMGKANSLVAEFQEIAKASVGTTKDFVMMASDLTRPVLAATGSMTALRDMTKGAVIAAKAFGVNAEVAAFDIEQALSGTMTSRDRLSRALLAPLGYDAADFNKLSAQMRADILQKALTGPAIADMAKAQEASFSGVMSTFEDNLQITLGKVGLPLFKALTSEVQKWNTWIDDNQEKIQQFGKSFGSQIVAGFNAIKEIGEFLVDNKDTLMLLAQAFVAYKGATLAGGLVGGISSTLTKTLESYKKHSTALTGASSAATQLADATSPAIKALGEFGPAVFAASYALGTWLDEKLGISTWIADKLGPDLDRIAAAPQRLIEQGAEFAGMSMGEDISQKWLRKFTGGAAPLAAPNVAGMPEAAAASVQERFARQAAENVATMYDAERDARVAAADQFLREASQEGIRVAESFSSLASAAEAVRAAGIEEGVSSLARGLMNAQMLVAQDPEALARVQARMLAQRQEPRAGAAEEDEKRKKEAEALRGARGKVDVTIQRIEVRTADPNRFVHDMNRVFEQFNRAPTRARAALEGGF